MEIAMNIPTQQLTATHDHDEGLTIYSNKYGVHTDFWKGVVVDDATKNVVARSFQASPCITTLEVPDDLVYTPIMESTVLRFYRHNGSPMISTHRNINIVGTRSRIGSGRFFFDLVKDAISGWENRTEFFEVEGKRGIAYTPDNWEDLCVEGMSNVFLLVDVSNQKTDLMDVSSYSHPLLLYSMSLKAETPEMIPVPSVPIWEVAPTQGCDIVGGDDKSLYEYVSWCLPTLPIIEKQQAEEILSNGGGVIGFKINSRDITTKFISPTYARKLDLVNDNTNIVHRWHELMDESVEKAREYLSQLPHGFKNMDEKFMREIASKQLDVTCAYLTNVIVSRFQGMGAPMPEMVERKCKSTIDSHVRRLKNKYSRGARVPTRNQLLLMVSKDLKEELSKLSYSLQHQLHSKIHRENIETSLKMKAK